MTPANLGDRLRGHARRIARAYHCRCAAEDVRTHRLRIPDGVWVCHRCWHVSLDLLSFRGHQAFAHAG